MAKTYGGAVKKKTSTALKRAKPLVAAKKRFKAAKKRFKAENGRIGQVAVLDANAATFGADLLNVFRENVAKARRENMRLFGSPDRVPADE
jgi:outer membrane protein TolC